MCVTRDPDTWQVGVYAPGGHYLPHYDDFDVLDPQAVTGAGVWVGNRLATAMAYLSEVQGGLEAGTLTIRTRLIELYGCMVMVSLAKILKAH